MFQSASFIQKYFLLFYVEKWKKYDLESAQNKNISR